MCGIVVETPKYINSFFAMRRVSRTDCRPLQVEFASRSTLKDMVTSKKSCRWRRLLRYYECEDELPLEGGILNLHAMVGAFPKKEGTP